MLIQAPFLWLAHAPMEWGAKGCAMEVVSGAATAARNNPLRGVGRRRRLHYCDIIRLARGGELPLGPAPLMAYVTTRPVAA